MNITYSKLMGRDDISGKKYSEKLNVEKKL